MGHFPAGPPVQFQARPKASAHDQGWWIFSSHFFFLGRDTGPPFPSKIIERGCTSPYDSSFYCSLCTLNTLNTFKCFWNLVTGNSEARKSTLFFSKVSCDCSDSNVLHTGSQRHVRPRGRGLNCAFPVHNLKTSGWSRGSLTELCFSGWMSRYLEHFSVLHRNLLPGLIGFHCTKCISLARGKYLTAPGHFNLGQMHPSPSDIKPSAGEAFCEARP